MGTWPKMACDFRLPDSPLPDCSQSLNLWNITFHQRTLQPFIKALPLTAVIDALRMNMRQGGNIAQVAPHCWERGWWFALRRPRNDFAGGRLPFQVEPALRAKPTGRTFRNIQQSMPPETHEFCAVPLDNPASWGLMLGIL